MKLKKNISKIKYLQNLLSKKQISCRELTEKYLESAQKCNKTLNAYVKITDEVAIESAKKVDEKISKNKELDQLEGIPMSLKDNIFTQGIETTCCSNMLKGFVPTYDATVWALLKAQNAVLVGKTNMDEFAMGCTCKTSCFGAVKNPHDLNKVPGGSSGGSAAAVCANISVYSLGTDTGGSIRQPASLCGIVGLKPTYGLVSRYGLVAFASSLDQIGPMTKDVKDAALLLNVISGHDEKDTTSAEVEKKDYTKCLKNDVKGLKIGVPTEFFGEGINPEVKAKVEEAIEKYKELGAEIEEFSLDIADYSLATYYIIAPAEASSNLGRFDGIRYGYRTPNYTNLKELFKNSRSEGFGSEVKRRIILGTYVLSSGYYDAYYKKAQQVRTLVKQEFKKAFEKYDVILTPTSPIVAFDIGTKSSNPMEMYLSDICTVPVNIAGVPAISIPCGVDSNNMPIGMQLIGNYFDEETILNAAYTYEQATNFRSKYRPNL